MTLRDGWTNDVTWHHFPTIQKDLLNLYLSPSQVEQRFNDSMFGITSKVLCETLSNHS